MARAPLRLINLIPDQHTPIETLQREPVQWVDATEDADVAFCWPQDVRQVTTGPWKLTLVKYGRTDACRGCAGGWHTGVVTIYARTGL